MLRKQMRIRENIDLSKTFVTFFWFVQEISDARAIRMRILNNFEQALHPGIPEEEQKRLLHIVIVGGGPTGVEFGAELYDFVKQVKHDVQGRF